jgi:hypothetical protein
MRWGWQHTEGGHGVATTCVGDAVAEWAGPWGRQSLGVKTGFRKERRVHGGQTRDGGRITEEGVLRTNFFSTSYFLGVEIVLLCNQKFTVGKIRLARR